MPVRLFEKNNIRLFRGKKLQELFLSFLASLGHLHKLPFVSPKIRKVISLSFQLGFGCALYKNWIMKKKTETLIINGRHFR